MTARAAKPGRDAANRRWEIAAIGIAVAIWTLLFVVDRGSFESIAGMFETGTAGGVDDTKLPTRHDPPDHVASAPATIANGAGEPSQTATPSMPASSGDILAPYPIDRPAGVHRVARVARRDTAGGTVVADVPEAGPQVAMAAMQTDFSLPDVNDVVVVAAPALVGLAAIELSVTRHADVVAASPPTPAPGGDVLQLPGPFHMFFTTEQPAGLAPAAGEASGAPSATTASSDSSASGAGGGLVSTVGSTAGGLVSTVGSTAGGLVSTVGATTGGLVSTVGSTATSLLRRH